MVAGSYDSTLDVSVSVRPSVRPSHRSITLVNINGFSTHLVYALIVWIYYLGLLLDKFRQILTVICPSYDSCGVLLFHIFISSYS